MEELSEVGRLANATELELIHAGATRLDEGRRMLPDACEALELARLDGAASLGQGIAARLGRARGRRTRRRRPRGHGPGDGPDFFEYLAEADEPMHSLSIPPSPMAIRK